MEGEECGGTRGRQQWRGNGGRGTGDGIRARREEAAHRRVEEQREVSPGEETETVATEVPTEEEIVETEQAEEEVGTAETEAVEETPLLAGKYKTTEELEKAYTEMQTVLGRQGAEVAELRGLCDEFVALREQIATPQTPQYDPGSAEEFIAENPAGIPAAPQQATAPRPPWPRPLTTQPVPCPGSSEPGSPCSLERRRPPTRATAAGTPSGQWGPRD